MYADTVKDLKEQRDKVNSGGTFDLQVDKNFRAEQRKVHKHISYTHFFE